MSSNDITIIYNAVVKRYSLRNGMAFIVLNNRIVLKTRNGKFMKELYNGMMISSITINKSRWIKNYAIGELVNIY